MLNRLQAAWSGMRARLEAAFWLLPAAIVLAAGAGALALLRLDETLASPNGFAFTGGPESARSVLATIATSMLTLTGLVFSITIVVLQLASTQFSPRVLRSFLRDRITQSTLGTFLAAFTYALLVLREVRGEAASVDEFVPGLAITGAFGLVAVSLVVFVRYIDHIAQSIRVVNILGRVATETEQVMIRRYPEAESDEHALALAILDTPPSVIPAHRPGVVVAIDTARLVALAQSAGATIALRSPIGTFVPAGAPLLEVFGGSVDPDAARAAVALHRERTMHDDPAFGFRQLVDIAERALSPGTNDPSTAAQAVDELHHLLRVLAGRSTDVGRHADDDGAVRLVVPEPGWADYLRLAVEEIAHWGSDSVQIRTRLAAMLDDLATAVDGDRRAAVHRARQEWTSPRTSTSSTGRAREQIGG